MLILISTFCFPNFYFVPCPISIFFTAKYTKYAKKAKCSLELRTFVLSASLTLPEGMATACHSNVSQVRIIANVSHLLPQKWQPIQTMPASQEVVGG